MKSWRTGNSLSKIWTGLFDTCTICGLSARRSFHNRSNKEITKEINNGPAHTRTYLNVFIDDLYSPG